MEHDLFETKSLAGMDPTDAFKQAFALSGLTEKQLMEKMGWKKDKTRRIFATGRYFPSFDELPDFCIVVGNTTIIQWIQMNVLQGKTPISYSSINCQNLFSRIGELFAEVGDVGQKGQEVVEDGQIDLGEARKMKKEVGDVMTKAIELMADLGALERELMEEQQKEEILYQLNENQKAWVKDSPDKDDLRRFLINGPVDTITIFEDLKPKMAGRLRGVRVTKPVSNLALALKEAEQIRDEFIQAVGRIPLDEDALGIADTPEQMEV